MANESPFKARTTSFVRLACVLRGSKTRIPAGEHDSGMMPNASPGCFRTVIRDEGEHRFRDEGEQF